MSGSWKLLFYSQFPCILREKKSICLLLFLLLPSVIRWRLYSLVKTVSFDFSNYTNNIKQIDVFQERNRGKKKRKKDLTESLHFQQGHEWQSRLQGQPIPSSLKGELSNFCCLVISFLWCFLLLLYSKSPTHSVCLFVFPDVPWTLLDFKANAVNVGYFQLEGDSLHPCYITQGLGCSKLGLSDTWLWGMSVKMPMKQERDS